VVGLRAGRVQTVGGCLRSGAGRARRHRQAQHVHQSLSHRVAVSRLVRGVGRAMLLSLVHPGNSSSNHQYVVHSNTLSCYVTGFLFHLWPRTSEEKLDKTAAGCLTGWMFYPYLNQHAKTTNTIITSI